MSSRGENDPSIAFYELLLVRASAIGNIDIVRECIKRINSLSGPIDSLVVAATNGHIDIVNALLESDCLPLNSKGNLALGAACRAGHIPVVQALLSSRPQSVAAMISAGDNFALNIACRNEATELCKLLFASGATVVDNSAIYEASAVGNQDLVQMLLENGGRDHAGENGDTAIEIACENGHIEVVKLLAACDSVYASAGFVAACRGGHIALVQLLLHDAHELLRQDGLKQACGNGYCIDVVKLLVEDGGVSIGQDEFQTTCEEGQASVVQWILQTKDADAVDVTANDNAAIREACSQGHIDIVEVLLQQKNVNAAACNNEAIRRARY